MEYTDLLDAGAMLFCLKYFKRVTTFRSAED